MRIKHSTLKHGLCGLLAMFMVVDPNAVQHWMGAAQQPVRAAEPGPQPKKDAAAKPTAEDLKRMADEMERGFKALEAAEREIPRDTFDPKAIVDKAGKDPVKLFEWVRDNTYWVPYRGALRGHTGVLMDRLGSSLDRALLLAELLRVAGHKVRLARAELTEEQAKTLLPKIRPVPKNPLPLSAPADQKALENLLDQYAKDFKLDGAALRKNAEKASLQAAKLAEEAVQRVADQVPVIAKAVGMPTAKQAEAARAAELALQLESVRDHWWVQQQDGARWADLDVLLPAAPSSALAKAAELIEPDAKTGKFKLDSKFCHEVQIRIVVEQWKKGKLAENAALSHTLRPSELFGERITLNHVPTNWPRDLDLFKEKEPLQKLKTTVLAQNEWLPVLMVGSNPIAQSSFGDSGDVYKDGLQMFAGFGKAVGNLDPFGAAKAVVGKEPRHKTEGVFSAEWIEYEIRSPGQPVQKIRRQVFDLLGPAARSGKRVPPPSIRDTDRSQRGLTLLCGIEVLPLVCQLSPDYQSHLMAKKLLANRQVLSDLLSSANGKTKDLTSELTRIIPLPSQLYSLANVRKDWGAFSGEVYVNRPNILSFATNIRMESGGQFQLCVAFDIVSNDLAVRPGVGLDQFVIRLHQGVLDTNAEALLMAGCATVENTAEILAAASNQNIPWLTIRSSKETAWRDAAIPPDVRARIDQDLTAGFVVIVPEKTVQLHGRPAIAWWRVDPIRGHTIGICETGSGGASTERPMLESYVLVSTAFAGSCLLVKLGRSAHSGRAPGVPGVAYCLLWGAVAGASSYGTLGTTALVLRMLAGGVTGGTLGAHGPNDPLDDY